MPTWSSFAAFGRELDQMAAEFERSARSKITREMAEAGQKIADAAAARDLGADRQFSGWAKKHPDAGRLDTVVKSGRDDSHWLMPTRASAGPWTTAQRGRNRGDASGFQGPGVNRKSGLTVRTKSGGLRKVRGAHAKRWTGYTDPKHTADEARERMEHELPKIAEKGVRRVMVKHFDVT